MLFLFSGRYREPARLILGIVLVVIGLLIQHGIILVAAGGVLALWGVFGSLAMLRRRRRDRSQGGGA
jgi:hypothetical protein